MLGQHLARAAGMEPGERATTWWASALRFLGCTGHAFEVAVLSGDEIELRAESLRADAANPVEFLRLVLTHAGPGESGLNRLRSVLAAVAGGRKAAEMNFRTACEVADAFAHRLGLGEPVRAALVTNFERWNGRERLDELDDDRHLIAYSVVEGTPLTVGVSGRIRLESAAHDITSVEWLTTVPNRAGSEDLVSRLKTYYLSRVEDLCAAVAGQ